MLDEGIKIRKLSKEISNDFYKVHRAGEYGESCLCGFWWVASTEGWDDRTEKESVAQREDLFARAIEDGYILYQANEAVGWCQVYQRDQLPNLVNTFHFDPDPEVWCFSCFMLIPEARGKGLAHKFLAAVLDDLKSRGIKKVQAFPRTQSGLPANEIWTGPEAIFRKAGFAHVADHPKRPIWEKVL